MKTTKLILTGIIGAMLCVTSCKKQTNITSEPTSENLITTQKGEWKEAYYLGSLISYQRINGQNVLDGDMIIPDNQLSSSPPQKNEVKTEGHGEGNIWPQGTIFYDIRPGFTLAAQNVILAAMDDWATRTGLRFVSRNRGIHLRIQPGNSNNCTIGHVQGATMNLSDPNARGIVVHELGHAIGFHHEQLRADRDAHILVNFDNIDPASHNGYNILPGMNNGGTLFDFESIMLYGSFNGHGAINRRLPTTTRLDGTIWIDNSWDGTMRPSVGDAQWVRTMYGL